jgi:hypothetical protein
MATDANFKQKARSRRNDGRDVALGPGWGATVESAEYNVHISEHAKGGSEEVQYILGISLALLRCNEIHLDQQLR